VERDGSNLRCIAHAHARGIIHGDLKPSNILVEEQPEGPPRVHVLDFGLAWLKQDRHDERLDGSKALDFTPHAGAGTPGYMAPEQIQHESHNVCGATDLYSLGCILHRMLSGKPPFTGESKELLRHHAFDVPIAPKLRSDAPHDSVHFILRMLAKQPWDRWNLPARLARNGSGGNRRMTLTRAVTDFHRCRGRTRRRVQLQYTSRAQFQMFQRRNAAQAY